MPESLTERRNGGASRIASRAHVLWIDNATGGHARLHGDSRAFRSMQVLVAEEPESTAPPTTPGELLAAAHSAAFTATVHDLLSRRGIRARELAVDATCQVETTGSRRTLRAVRLRVLGRGARLSEDALEAAAETALACCPFTRALCADVAVTVETRLIADA